MSISNWIKKLAIKHKKPPYGPYEFNCSIFEKFYADLQANNLPDVPDATDDEIAKYLQERKERLHNISPDIDGQKLRHNLENIPVDVQIWVDKVDKCYFDTLIPMLGLVHWHESAERALYEYKGYAWFTSSEVHPDCIID